MFTKRIIPCLDVNNGRVVKGINFVNLRDAGDPVEVGAAYGLAGADELVFLDITASSDARNIKLDMVRRVAETVFIPFTVGGGIRTVEDFRVILREGADKIAVNSAAILNPSLISEAADKFGSQCVVVAIDAKRRPDGSGWNIYKNGLTRRWVTRVLRCTGSLPSPRWRRIFGAIFPLRRGSRRYATPDVHSICNKTLKIDELESEVDEGIIGRRCQEGY